MTKEIKYIHDTLSPAALYGQLAEEAAELAQAALKMQRCLMEENPPRKHQQDIRDNIEEELADINICCNAIGIKLGAAYQSAIKHKPQRWAAAICKLQEGE